MRAGNVRGAAAALATIALVAGGLVVAQPAWAASYAVDTAADGDANNACGNPAVVTTASPVTLRNALCVASNAGGAATVAVPAGTYTLGALGPLQLGTQTGADITVVGTGSPEIVGNGSTQLLIVDPNLIGGVDVTLEGLAFEGGRDTVFGGGAIIAGSGTAPTADELVIRNSSFGGNRSTGGSANPGGAIQFLGGSLTIEDSTFTNNDSDLAAGGAVYYEAMGVAPGEGLSITGSAFTGNTARAAGALGNGGGAVAFDTNGHGTVEITGNAFDANLVATADASPTLGGAIRQVQGPATITGNTFTGNAAAGASAGGGAIDAGDGSLTARFNRFSGNTGAAALRSDASSNVTATHNWWGCATGPGAAPCDAASIAAGAAAPYLTLTASPASAMVDVEETTTLTASLLVDSAGGAVAPADLGAFESLSVAWSSATPAGSSASPASDEFDGGTATTTFTAGTTGGVGGATAGLDQASVPVAVTVREPAAFTSATTAAAVVGTAMNFTVTTSGYPVPAVALDSGTLPSGLSFVANADGTATLSGTPAAGTEGDVVLGLSADNGGAPATQSLTLSVGSKPVFTGPPSITVAAGAAVDATITATGRPVPVITAASPLPTGLTLVDQGDGTAKLSGTPTVPPGLYPLLVKASNANGETTASVVLTITTPPSFTSVDHADFVAGAAGAFAVTVDAGVPADAGAVTLDAGAPVWLSLAGATGSQQLVGTPPAGSGGVHEFTLSVTNSAGTTVQDFTLTVAEAPTYGGPTALAGEVGVALEQILTFGGSPKPAVSVTAGSLPIGLTASDLGDGRIRISGTPGASGAGAHALTVTATSSAGTLPQPVTLSIGLAPAFTSADHSTFTVGQAGVFDVTVAPGYPAPGAVSLGAGAPAWLSLTGAAGSQQLVGTPPAGSGGVHEFALSVSNGTGTATQDFTLTVAVPPVFTSSATLGALAGDAVDAYVVASGFPTPTVALLGTLPAGLSSTALPDGRLHLTGTVAAGDAGVYPVDFGASNAGGTAAQTLTITIGLAPSITSADRTTFTVGTAGAFAISVEPGVPAAGAVTLDAAPPWLSLAGAAGAQQLVGTPPAGSGGTIALTLTATNASGTATQDFTLTVNEAPLITAQPSAQAVVAGADASFTAGANGFPAPTVQWQRFDGAGWADVPGATSATLTITTALADDGARFRAVFTSAAGTATSDEAVLTVGTVPDFGGVAPVMVRPGAARTFDVAVAGHPAPAISVVSGLPSWLSFVDNGDGTATFSGTPGLDDDGLAVIVMSAANGFGIATGALSAEVNADVVPPFVLPTADGVLAGVPTAVQRGQTITVSGTGFLPGAPIAFGIYSAPSLIGFGAADGSGAFSTSITVPAGQSFGAHTIVATGVGAGGVDRLLAASTVVVEPAPPSGGPGSASGVLSATGVEPLLPMLAAAIAVLAGLALLTGFAIRRRSRRG